MDRRLTGRLQVGIFAAAVGQASGSGAAELPCPPVCGRQRSAAALAEGPATGVPERGSGPGAAHMPAATAAGRSEQMTRPAGPVPGTGVGADSISRPARQVHLAVLMAFAATGQPPSPAEIERLIRAGGGEPDGDVGHAQMPGHHPRSRARHRPGHHRRGRRRPGPVDAPVRGRVRRPAATPAARPRTAAAGTSTFSPRPGRLGPGPAAIPRSAARSRAATGRSALASTSSAPCCSQPTTT